MNNIEKLFGEELTAVNIGLDSFAENLTQTGARTIHVEWQPPAGGDPVLGRQLALLAYDDVLSQKIDEANEEAVTRIIAARPVLVGIQPARTALGLEDNTFLHAGPPIDYKEMCGPMQGAAIGAMLFEGLASNAVEAREKLEAGEINFSPNHHYRAVGPMAGLTSPSMALFVVRNETHGNLTYASINEGLGKVLRFGAYDREVIDRLKWINDFLAPKLAHVLSEENPIDLRALTAQALQMGDECHNRNVAATSLLFKELTTRLLNSTLNPQDVADVLTFIAANDHFFLNLSMACCKGMLDVAANIPYSTIATVMCRNGVEFGLRISGTGDKWFTAPAELPEGLYFGGYSEDDAALDLGDSAISETAGIGGFAMAAAPAIVGFVGGTAQEALNYTREMGRITIRKNPNYELPSLNFEGAPLGIDIRRVLETGLRPVINTGIAHKEPGIGQIGAGIARAPMTCFTEAMNAFLDSTEGVQ